MLEPLVSVIIPAYNGEDYLAEAITSVLNQNYKNYEILVIDNNSTDNTKRVAKNFAKVKYIYAEIADTARARNQGISLAQGKYLAFLDQDDVWVNTKLKKQVDFLESQAEYEAVIGLQRMYLQSGHQKPHWLKQEFLTKPQAGYLPSALMVRRSAFERTNHFDINFSLTSDVAWFFKAKHMGMLIGTIEEVVVNRRIHNDNTSNKYAALHSELLSVIKTSLKNRRQ